MSCGQASGRIIKQHLCTLLWHTSSDSRTICNVLQGEVWHDCSSGKIHLGCNQTPGIPNSCSSMSLFNKASLRYSVNQISTIQGYKVRSQNRMEEGVSYPMDCNLNKPFFGINKRRQLVSYFGCVHVSLCTANGTISGTIYRLLSLMISTKLTETAMSWSKMDYVVVNNSKRRLL